MGKDVTYNVHDVVKRLSVKIANLEARLAHEQVAKEAYMKRVQELEQNKDTDENAE